MLPISIIQQEFDEAKKVLDAFSSSHYFEKVAQAGELMATAIKQGNKIISCGNGGSHCDAMHFAEELTGRYRDNRKALPALCISDVSHLSCVSNDYGYEFVFSRFLEGIGKSGDVLLAISTSGNSPNVLRAAEYAKKSGIHVVSLTGKDGGKLAALSDVEIRVPHQGYADRIQEIHIKVIHSLILYIEKSVL